MQDKFNNYHNKLKFTIEYERNHCSFLDLSLTVKKKKEIIIEWFHKDTFSGHFLSYFSNCPIIKQA